MYFSAYNVISLTFSLRRSSMCLYQHIWTNSNVYNTFATLYYMYLAYIRITYELRTIEPTKTANVRSSLTTTICEVCENQFRFIII